MKKLGEFLGDVFACCFWGVVAILVILLVAAAKNGLIALVS
jgi:hypothetical protein